MANLFTDILLEDTHWANPDADYATLLTTLGGGSGGDRNLVQAGVLGTAVNSPVGLAFVLAGDPDHVYVGYEPMLYPGDLTAATVYDNQVAVLVGNDLDAASLLSLPPDAFGRCNDTHCQSLDYLRGAEGFAHPAAAVFRHAIPGVGDPDVTDLRDRRAMLLPRAFLIEVLGTAPAGCLTLQSIMFPRGG